MSRTRLPLSVIGGFLGAGKTTLLNHWLRHAGAAGQRLAVLVNDFGALDIDARLIESSAGDTFALTNGCVCCQIGDDLSLALVGVLENAQRFDAVVIEASGVSDPWRIAQLGRADPGLSLDGVIVIVDAASALEQSRDPLLADTMERQLRAADLVVVNKCDLVDAGERHAVSGWIGSVAGSVPQFETHDAEVPMALLSSAAMPAVERRSVDDGTTHRAHLVDPRHPPAHDHRHGHTHASPDHGALFETWSCRPETIFDAVELRAWLRQPPAGLLRLKGVLQTSTNGAAEWAELQFAGRHGSLRPTAAPTDGSALVAIALRGRLPVVDLEARFAPNSTAEVGS